MPLPMYGHRDRRDVTVKERFHDGNGDEVNYKLRETHYAPAAATAAPQPAPAATPALGKHVLKIKEKINQRSPKKNATTTTTTTTKTTTTPPPVFVAPPVTTTQQTILPSLMTLPPTLPPLNSAAAPVLNTMPPLEVNAQECASTTTIETPPVPEAINGTQVTPQPPLVLAAETITPPLQTFQYLPEHTYVAYDPIRFTSLPPTPLPPPVITSTTYVVHDQPIGTASSTTTANTTTTNSSNNGRRLNIRIKEKLSGAGADPNARRFKLRERIRTKA